MGRADVLFFIKVDHAFPQTVCLNPGMKMVSMVSTFCIYMYIVTILHVPGALIYRVKKNPQKNFHNGSEQQSEIPELCFMYRSPANVHVYIIGLFKILFEEFIDV